MKTKYLYVIGLIGIILIGVCYKSGAADKKSTTNTKRISAADKAAIKEILKGAKPTSYRVQFDGGKDTMGAKKLALASVRQTQKSGSAGALAYLADDGDIMICWKGTQPRKLLEGDLGAEKVARLDAILARYR
jgi:hypothetical protein